MNIESFFQLGFAGGVATYLLVFLIKDLKTGQTKIISTLECIAEALNIKLRDK